MPLLNYTSKIASGRTAAEISKDLLKLPGVRGIATEYENGRHTGLTFAIVSPGETFHYSLPVRIDAVRDVLVRQRVEKRYQTAEHAESVAWRILRDWVRAQVAIIETEMVTLQQVMLPYMRTPNGDTVFERWQISRALPADSETSV